ncbi:aminoglycoside phosphotransferase, partial [Azospirillum brasilense]|nr:aminoglycoside phosphotransferase [Azospirillum brasilense]
MSGSTGTAGLHSALTQLPAFAGLPLGALEPMPRRGVAHDHVRLSGKGLVARVPRWSQLGLDPFANLEQQATAFRRAASGGHTPELATVLPPGPELHQRDLWVPDNVGRQARPPGEVVPFDPR